MMADLTGNKAGSAPYGQVADGKDEQNKIDNQAGNEAFDDDFKCRAKLAGGRGGQLAVCPPGGQGHGQNADKYDDGFHDAILKRLSPYCYGKSPGCFDV